MTITNQQIIEAFDAAGHEYLEIDDLVKTQDDLANFRSGSKGWAECRSITVEKYCGFDALEFDGVQRQQGLPRGALTVIDFGNVRYAYPT